MGLALLEFAIGRAQGRGARSLTLNTNERNETALRLYRKAGFVLQSEGIYGDGREICLERKLYGAERTRAAGGGSGRSPGVSK